MHVQAQEVLCCYHYDALDWLTGTTSERDAELQRFYCKSRLATEVQGGVQRSIFQHDDLLLAQHNQQGVIAETSLMATDQMRSVLQTVETNQVSPIAYSPYGHRSAAACLLSLLGFNGERPDPVTGYYLLGNGYRAFNPTLMRFNSPDSFSPFDGGGLNSYSYCIGDPVNRYDDSGHLPKFLQSIFRMFVKTPNVESVMPPVSSTGRRLTLYDSNLTEYDELMYKQIPKNHQFRHKIPPKKIESYRDLNSILYEKELEAHARTYNGEYNVNFIFNERKELFVGSVESFHLARFTNSRKVIAAGTIKRVDRDAFTISNVSSFNTVPHSLDPVKDHLESLGANIRGVYLDPNPAPSQRKR